MSICPNIVESLRDPHIASFRSIFDSIVESSIQPLSLNIDQLLKIAFGSCLWWTIGHCGRGNGMWHVAVTCSY